jgi:hypothetical protein
MVTIASHHHFRKRNRQMTAGSEAETDFNASHTPTRPGLVAYGVLGLIVVLLAIFMFTT